MNKKANQGRDYATILIWSAVAVTVVRYIGAFVASDVGSIEGGWSEILTVLMGLTGIGMGLLDTLGGAYLFDGWRQKMPSKGKGWSTKFKILSLFVFSLFIVGLLILVPFTVSRVSHKSMADVLGEGTFLWVWSLAVNIAPYILIGGVATSHRIVSSDLDEKVSENLPKEGNGEKKVSENLPKDWRKLRPTLSYEQVVKMANLNADQVKAVSKAYQVDERTVINWRMYAGREAEKGRA
jgi:MFS family permease